jgi:hypothetical protein
MCWNQPARVDYLRKKWRVAQKKNHNKGAGRPCPGVDPQPATSDQQSPADRGSTHGHGQPGLFFFDFFDFFDASSYTLVNFFIENLGNGPRLLGEWVHNTPIFSSFPLHLEVSNLPFLIEFGDFTFFEILFFLNLE